MARVVFGSTDLWLSLSTRRRSAPAQRGGSYEEDGEPWSVTIECSCWSRCDPARGANLSASGAGCRSRSATCESRLYPPCSCRSLRLDSLRPLALFSPSPRPSCWLWAASHARWHLHHPGAVGPVYWLCAAFAAARVGRLGHGAVAAGGLNTPVRRWVGELVFPAWPYDVPRRWRSPAGLRSCVRPHRVFGSSCRGQPWQDSC